MNIYKYKRYKHKKEMSTKMKVMCECGLFFDIKDIRLHDHNKFVDKKYIKKENNMKVTCECGSTFLKDNLKAHEATIKHKTYLTKKDMKNAGKKAQIKVTCQCGVIVNEKNLKRHQSSLRCERVLDPHE